MTCEHKFDGPVAHNRTKEAPENKRGIYRRVPGGRGSRTCSKCGLSKAMHEHLEQTSENAHATEDDNDKPGSITDLG